MFQTSALRRAGPLRCVHSGKELMIAWAAVIPPSLSAIIVGAFAGGLPGFCIIAKLVMPDTDCTLSS